MIESIKIISSFSILIPLMFASGKVRTGELKIRLFFAFLLVGFMTDLLGFVNFKTDLKIPYLGYIYFLYSYLEAIFFTWIGTEYLEKSMKKKIRFILFPLISILFLGRLMVIIQEVTNFLLSPFVDSGYLISTAFLTGFSLLRLAEKELDLLKFPWFWILSGIFFYSFGSFFIDVLKGSVVIEEIWPIRNIMNILQYGFFVMGLVLFKSDLPQKRPFFSN